LEDKASVFGVDSDKTKIAMGWDLKHVENEELEIWLVYINQRVFCTSQLELGMDELIHIGLFAWNGEHYD